MLVLEDEDEVEEVGVDGDLGVVVVDLDFVGVASFFSFSGGLLL